jgi:hypothetical protein
MSTLYIREQGCEDPCLLFEAKWVRQQEILVTNNLVLLIFNHLFNDASDISGCIATNGRVNSEWRIGNNLEGSGFGLPQVPVRCLSGGTERITVPFSMLKCPGRVSSQASPEFRSVLERTCAGSSNPYYSVSTQVTHRLLLLLIIKMAAAWQLEGCPLSLTDVQ